MTPGWIRDLPSTWDALPLRAAADYVVSNVDKVPVHGEIPVRLCNYTDVYNNEFITLRLKFMQATATEVEITKFGLSAGDVVITKDSESWDDIGIPALVRETASHLVCGYHLALLRPRKQRTNGAFLFRCLQAKPVRVQLELAANGVTRFGIPTSDIGALTIPVPPLEEQRAIADFLDRETAKLDALVAAKERLLAILAEKRRALIARAVTRGLDPDVPLRDSGIPWLGEIPRHWDVRRLTTLFRERDERCEPDLPLLEVSINSGVVLREFADDRIEATAADFNSYKVARSGDIVFNKMRMWQGAVGVAPQDGLVSPDYVVAAPKDGGVLPAHSDGPRIRLGFFGRILIGVVKDDAFKCAVVVEGDERRPLLFPGILSDQERGALIGGFGWVRSQRIAKLHFNILSESWQASTFGGCTQYLME